MLGRRQHDQGKGERMKRTIVSLAVASLFAPLAYPLYQVGTPRHGMTVQAYRASAEKWR